jgi:ABC-2 type transport system permease protein
MLPVFVLTPLSMLGGSFFTLAMLPQWFRVLTFANPFFYFVNGVRQSMLGITELPGVVGYAFTMAVVVVMFLWVLRLYSKGYGLRE